MKADNRFTNNFDFLRLAGALLVIFYTSFGVLGPSAIDPLSRLTNGVFNTGNLGVAIFFIISGYLITMSWDKRRDIVRFLWARFLRLVPALVGVALFTVFIIGPLATHQTIGEYLTSGLTWGYFSIISVFFPAYQLPGVFIHNPVDKVNGALWTLPIESTMYLVILAAGVLGVLNKKRLATFLTLSALGLYLYLNIHTMHTIIPVAQHDLIDTLKYYINSISPFYPFYFLIGSVFYLNSDRIKFDFRLVLLAFVIWVISFSNYDLLLLSSFICLPYAVLGTAFTRIPYLSIIRKKADISYGLYIYHYPVQQTLINFFKLDPLTLFIIALVITVPLAWLSWHLIESRALSLKNINLKIFDALSGTSARAIQTFRGYCNSAGDVIKHKPVATTIKGRGKHLAYLYEMRGAIVVVIVAYVLFAAIGFAMGGNYQSATPVTTDSSISCGESLGNVMSINTVIGAFVNNLLYCFIAMVSGIFIGVVPIVSIITNGLTLGWYAGITLPKTCLLHIMAGSIPYGLFELPALWLSSAIGLKLGYSLIRSLTGKKGFVQELRKGAMAFAFWVLPIIAIAAVVETFIALPALSLMINWMC